MKFRVKKGQSVADDAGEHREGAVIDLDAKAGAEIPWAVEPFVDHRAAAEKAAASGTKK